MSPVFPAIWLMWALAADGLPTPEASAPNSLVAGKMSLTAALVASEGSALSQSIGAAYIVTSNVAVILRAQLALGRRELLTGSSGALTFTEFNGRLAPGIRVALTPQQAITPYLLATIGGALARRAPPSGSSLTGGTVKARHSKQLEVVGAFGVEWFVVPQVSVSADMGLRVGLLRQGSAPPPVVATFTSQLLGSFYW